jgi:hypothetical protein
MSNTQETMRPKPSDYAIDRGDPEIDQALADLVEMGLVVEGEISQDLGPDID